MVTEARPRRSMLFMPGSNARAIEKAKTLPADGLIFDLEDAVAPDAKVMAREQVCAAVRAGGYGGRELVVRANALTTLWGRDDLAAVATCGAHAVLVPKVESADGVRQVISILTEHGGPDSLAIWCMLETPLGILRAESIATASPRVAALVMGTSDLTKDLQAKHTRERTPLLHSLGHCLLVGRAYGLVVLDGVHLELSDDEGFAEVCRQGAEMGFDGKTLIHPKTIDAANAAYAPSPEDVAWARRVMEAHAEAEAKGQGVVLVDGQLIENLHVESAQRVVRIAESIAALEAV
ncbi:HpcH/HpaI aldolase/citrate lyase family protein [Candidatus Entotheonella palauensis]|uniref:(3S)-malyl-CoA thiolesterase n=1 Tax=Candidatus Entotheonella gemina TaxID=1429439 RepID=W4M873_9BACT|nr:CoA ester lyase [Candidatus Entotheonella palauensis]ETX05817.1 MAG: (3S)-malyl-CoA thiolesterase [Candidatus Entotheonella gemina]